MAEGAAGGGKFWTFILKKSVPDWDPSSVVVVTGFLVGRRIAPAQSKDVISHVIGQSKDVISDVLGQSKDVISDVVVTFVTICSLQIGLRVLKRVVFTLKPLLVVNSC